MFAKTLCVLLVAAVAVSAVPLDKGGKHWALLIAGSNTWGNYRHQADVYHSYQIMKKNGIPDENIVVMHYDDIADNSENPRKGQVINSPTGSDVYKGVPKDYTGSDVNADNFLAVLAGDKSRVNGGSGKVIASGPNDKVFVYYADHGGTGILGMPQGQSFLYGKDIVKTLQQKHASNGFKELTFYIEACESGSIFEGSLPENINVYATTASNPSESSWGTYCPGMHPAPPSEFNTCLGDLYSVAWLENADAKDLKSETLEEQYKLVKDRTSQNGSYSQGSHVMQYGDVSIDSEDCAAFMGDMAAENVLRVPEYEGPMETVEQRDAKMLHLNTKYMRATGAAKAAALRQLSEETFHRTHLDSAFEAIAQKAGFSLEKLMGAQDLKVQDWDCYKESVEAVEDGCGALGDYGMKYGRVLVGLCNAGVKSETLRDVSSSVCEEM